MNHRMIAKIALRNVFLHRLRTLIAGSILIFGSLLAILGNSLVDGVAGGMKNSVTQSITGDIQIFSDTAKEKLSVFGNMDGSVSDVGHVKNYSAIEKALMNVPGVAAVVPMGTSGAMFSPGNLMDTATEKLRSSYKANASKGDLDAQKQRLRFLVQEIEKNLDGKFDEIGILSPKEVDEAKVNLKVVNEDAFWADFDANFESKCEFLANKIAPLIFDDNLVMFNFVGTDPQEFKNRFPQFEIVKGEMIPEGSRGFLFHDFIYENLIKHRIARRLDQIKKKMRDNRTTIAASKELQDLIKTNRDQSAEIYLQLGPIATKEIGDKIAALLKSDERDFRVLVKKYLEMDDSNFEERVQFFYAEIAPSLVLYRVGIGEVIPLNAFTKTGTSTGVNVKVYGTFRFKSFENSPLAGNFSVIDLISFRELYGFLTDERRAQNKEIEAEMALAEVDRDNIENLFSAPSVVRTVVDQTKSGEPLAFKKKMVAAKYSEEELKQGVFMHAAVFLENPRRIDAAIGAINDLSKKENLGIQAVTWQEAAGFIGMMTSMMKGILNLFIIIALGLAGAMIMNSLLMAAMDRKQEIGTMRAIGAESRFVYLLFFYETLILSLLFGGLGTLFGSVLVLWIGQVGIPAAGDVATFFFSGPRLFLHLDPSLVITVLVTMVIIAVLATQYPAWKAMRISPLQAMQKRE